MITLPPAPAKLTGTPIGTAGSYQNDGNTIAKVFDGNASTWFDAPVANGAWVGLDLGVPMVLSRVDFAPRADWSGFAQRMVNGRFEGSNTADFSAGVSTLATVATAPTKNASTSATVSGTFRYVRYVGPDGGYCNIAELAVYGAPVIGPLAGVATVQPPYPTTWTTPPAAAHTYYIDGTLGNDANVGTDPAHPFQTTAPALKLAKDGDAIRFAYGSVNAPFTGWLMIANAYVGPYGDATKPRPILNVTGAGVALHAHGSGALIQFLDVRGDRTACKGVALDGSHARIEGCSITSCFQGLVVTGGDGTTVFRCNVSHNYRVAGIGHDQGIYTDTATDLLLDSCTINYNGWDGVNPATSDQFCHGAYLDDDVRPLAGVTVHNCVVAENGAWGVEGRPGGVADDNLFVDNGLNGGAIFMGGVNPELCNNVFTGALDAPARATPRGTGIGCFSQSGNVHDNVFCNSAGPVGAAIKFNQVDSNKLDMTVGAPTLANNVISNWHGWGVHFDVGRRCVTMCGNRFGVAGGNPLFDVHVAPGSIVASGNTYAAGSFARLVTGQTLTLAQWASTYGDATPVGPVPTISATLEGYAQLQGLPPSGQALLAATEANCGPAWTDACSAHAVNSYFRVALAASQAG